MRKEKTTAELKDQRTVSPRGAAQLTGLYNAAEWRSLALRGEVDFVYKTPKQAHIALIIASIDACIEREAAKNKPTPASVIDRTLAECRAESLAALIGNPNFKNATANFKNHCRKNGIDACDLFARFEREHEQSLQH